MKQMITNRQAVCGVLLKAAGQNSDLVVVCSDSRGSASLTKFAEQYPKQFLELGIAEQNLVSVSAGLSSCGKKVVAASPASFLTTRSYEQAKVDVAYSGTDVILLGISGGISYGALGMTHHSCQDIAAFAALPGMRVYLPSDRFLTARLMEALLQRKGPAYVRVSRSATEDVYGEDMEFTLDRAKVLGEGADALIVACGEMVPYAVKARRLLLDQGIHAGVLDMYCVKPLDEDTLLRAAERAACVFTVEEHSPFGGLGSMVAQAVAKGCPRRVVNLSLPDGPILPGNSREVFHAYGLDAEGIARTVREVLKA